MSNGRYTPVWFRKKDKGEKVDWHWGTRDQSQKGHLVKRNNKTVYHRTSTGQLRTRRAYCSNCKRYSQQQWCESCKTWHCVG